jgi:tetratricopeptide (TPR) repeat protein/predicted Ser/Thr protein kinase
MKHVVRLLFHEVADLTRSERNKLFAERRIAPEVRAEIESLLNFDSTNDHDLSASLNAAALDLLKSGVELMHWGAYRGVRILGVGGVGAVYLAERTDGEIQQLVAVKVLRADVVRPTWHDRFLKERQLLASLNHTSIAHLIDAGRTGDGTPYLVMEYVDGVSIDVYAQRMSLSDQLRLFLKVCEGVSHAHRHLIIHRDLKPSNILVDATGQPKLLDFGIAKLLDETGEPTQTMDRLLTMNYSSPEQVRGAAQTTATDVYSLGAVLYKLLIGRSPHESNAEPGQAIDVITGIRDILPPSRLNPKLPRDIDFILGKALRREPEERYASVEAFANDLCGFLEYRPVTARAGNVWYLTRRYLRRHWLPVASVALAFVALFAGLLVANREKALAQQRFVQVRQLANKLFDIDYQVRQLPANTKARQLIVDTSLEYLRRLGSGVRDDPDLALDVGTAYMRVGRVQGVAISANLGQLDQAEQSLGLAESAIHSVLLAQPTNRTAFLRMAQIAHDRMILARYRRDYEGALSFTRKSDEWLEKLYASGFLAGAGKMDKAEAEAALLTYTNVANNYVRAEQFDDALRLLQRGSDIAHTWNWQPDLGALLYVKADVLRRRGDLDEALNTVQESVRIWDHAKDNRNDQGTILNFALALIYQGFILGEDNAISLGRPKEAVASLERAFQIADRFVHQDPNDSNSRERLVSGINLADILRQWDPSAALTYYDHALRHLAEIQNNARFRRAEVIALAGSTYSLRRLGRTAEARHRLDGAFERLSQLKLYPAERIELGSETDVAVRALADHEADTGNIPHAIEIYEKLVAQIMASKPKVDDSLTDAVRLSRIYLTMVALHRRAGQPDLASALETHRLQLWQTWKQKLPQNAFVRRQLEAENPPAKQGKE